MDYPTPSQVIISKTISKPDKLKSVTEKIALQINCKIGGALWALKNPIVIYLLCQIVEKYYLQVVSFYKLSYLF